MGRLVVVAVLGSMACGRYAFDPVAGEDPAGDGTRPDGDVGPAGSEACVSGDGACRDECVGRDDDCVAVCGDGRCDGIIGELCGACRADCSTLQPVCGNAACDPGESTTCYADCGPVPWKWEQEEQEVIAEINRARTNGTQCPGGMPTTAPALTLDAGYAPMVREWAWESAHHEYFSGGGACNGRTLADRRRNLAFTSNVAIATTMARPTADVVRDWLADELACSSVMNPSYTRIGVGVADDAERAYVVVFR